MRLFLTSRQRSRLINWIIFCVAVFLFITWNREGAKLYKTNHVGRTHLIPNYTIRRFGPGENGEGVYLEGEEKRTGEEQVKNAYMVFSDKISLDRSIPDSRSRACLALSYPKSLPTASVVIIFTDEFLSALLRTVHSVVNRTPPHLLKEIILVDDDSNRGIGTFWWSLHYSMGPMPKSEIERRTHPETDYIRSLI
ncbi:hypothetical protein RB195_008230 [Necator americanus]|uniref:Glycosyltransferase 2-like domain-containing protein n=1 Tax=Necator americanus TaxID=51031 RepID=A0ABR1CML3_NECAM